MAAIGSWVRRLKPVRLRSKLLIGFVTLASLSAVVGAIGVIFVGRVASSVGILTNVATPLLIENVVLVDSARSMRAIVFRAINAEEDVGTLRDQLRELDSASSANLTRIAALATAAGIDPVNLLTATRFKDEYVATLDRVLELYRRERDIEKLEKVRMADFARIRDDIDGLLADINIRAEAELARIEGEAKVMVQVGSASLGELGDLLARVLTDLYPVIQHTRQLRRDSAGIDELVKRLGARPDESNIAVIDRDMQAFVRSVDTSMRWLTAHDHAGATKQQFAGLQRDFSELTTMVLGSDGLIAGRRQIVAARTEISAGLETLDQIAQAYRALIFTVRTSIDRLSDEAHRDAQASITRSSLAIQVTVLIAVLAALLFGYRFAERINTPLTALTNHAAGIRKSGELIPLSGAPTLRVDEIGSLARSFNSMITELADARQRLIEASEEEIRIEHDRMTAAINNMPQGLCMFDAAQRLVVCNGRYAEIYKLSNENTVAGTPLQTILQDHVSSGTSPRDASDYIKAHFAAIRRASAGLPCRQPPRRQVDRGHLSADGGRRIGGNP